MKRLTVRQNVMDDLACLFLLGIERVCASESERTNSEEGTKKYHKQKKDKKKKKS